jgi:hypothetical protein
VFSSVFVDFIFDMNTVAGKVLPYNGNGNGNSNENSTDALTSQPPPVHMTNSNDPGQLHNYLSAMNSSAYSVQPPQQTSHHQSDYANRNNTTTIIYQPPNPSSAPLPGMPSYLPATNNTVPSSTSSSYNNSSQQPYSTTVGGQQGYASPSSSSGTVQNEIGAKEYLSSKNWPPCMIDNFLKSLDFLPYRYFICDDSGSMSQEDGKIACEYNGQTKALPCTRWKELTTSLHFHADLAYQGGIASEFRFLNTGIPFRIGYPKTRSDISHSANYENFKNILSACEPGKLSC